MDVTLLLQHSQYAIPIGIVLICAILVFAFGFKKAEQPPFAQLSDVDRKLSNKKRGKTKDKVGRQFRLFLSFKILLFFFLIYISSVVLTILSRHMVGSLVGGE